MRAAACSGCVADVFQAELEVGIDCGADDGFLHQVVQGLVVGEGDGGVVGDDRADLFVEVLALGGVGLGLGLVDQRVGLQIGVFEGIEAAAGFEIRDSRRTSWDRRCPRRMPT